MILIPDVLGMKFERAEKELKGAGVTYTVKTLSPPAGSRLPEKTETRIVRQLYDDVGGAVVLYVCEV